MDYDEYKVRDEFLSLVEVKNCTAQGIYELIVNFFLKYSVPYKKNLIAFASDGANTMFGQHHSVKTLLENDNMHHMPAKKFQMKFKILLEIYIHT